MKDCQGCPVLHHGYAVTSHPESGWAPAQSLQVYHPRTHCSASISTRQLCTADPLQASVLLLAGASLLPSTHLGQAHSGLSLHATPNMMGLWPCSLSGPPPGL